MDRDLPAELARLLARFRWRLRRQNGLAFAQRTLWLAILGSGLVLLSGRLWPLEGVSGYAWLPPAAWLLACLGVWLFKPYPEMRVALQVDGELGLKERVSTCLAFSAANGPEHSGGAAGRARPEFDARLVEQMNTDALGALRAAEPGRAFPVHFERRAAALAAGLLALTLVLLVLPNPMDQVLAERKAAAQAAHAQAQKIEKLKEEIEKTAGLSEEEKEKLRQQLAELARQLKANPGDRAQALADLSRAEQALRERQNGGAAAQKAALAAIAARLQALAGTEKSPANDELEQAAEDLQKLADSLGQLSQEQRDQLSAALGQLAARAAQAGDTALAQALAGMAQAARAGDSSAAQSSAQAGQQALAQAGSSQAAQQALQRALAGVQSSRQALAQSGQSAAQGSGQGQGQAQGQGQGQGQSQGQGQGQGQQPGGGGGSNANTLPGYQGQGAFKGPTSAGQSAGEGTLNPQVYVPRQKQPAGGNKLDLPGQDTGQGQEQTSQSPSPLPGANNPALVPYQSVYQSYLDSAGQALDQSAIPAGLKDFVKNYFSQLEP